MHDDHKQILLGSLLGGSYICQGTKNCYLCMRHSINHLPWLQSKADELKEYASANPWYVSKNTATWRSVSDPVFTELKQFCYSNGKKEVHMEWLDKLRDIAIAVWYGDSGALVGRKFRNACLRTQSFGQDGNKIIEKYFNEVGLSCHLNKSRNSYIVVFTVHGTESLIKMIAPCLPKNRYGKLLAGQFRNEVV
jgi:LAGLIDADG DNA endonuclease family